MNEYEVDLTQIAKGRTHGVSGMMRVRNDSEFIDSCIDSCIDALDELVIVYNDCSDNSPELIKAKQKQYPEKIKVYEYKPNILAWDLTQEQADDIISGKTPKINTLANYYNYALSKTTKQFVMKIDADQIYYTPKLKEICDAYRSASKCKATIFEYLCYAVVRFSVLISSILNIKINILSFSKLYREYYSYVIKSIVNAKPTTSMCGLNTSIIEDKIYVSLGRYITNGTNILPSYNGDGDHLIFKVNNNIGFIPIIDSKYNALNGLRISVIEQFTGVKCHYFLGPMWIHLNSCRKSTYLKTQNNFKIHKDCFELIEQFSNKPYLSQLKESNMVNNLNKTIFSFLHLGVDAKFIRFFQTKCTTFIKI